MYLQDVLDNVNQRAEYALAEYVARMEEMRNKCNVLIVKLEQNTLFGRPRRRWNDDINVGFKKLGFAGLG